MPTHLTTASPAVPPSLIRYALLDGVAGLVHAVTTRAGGVSRSPFAGLNLGLHVGDDPPRVLANRALVATALGVRPADMVFAAQVHGAEVAVVGGADAGRGALDGATAVAGADALVSAAPGILLGVLVADCAPILLADPLSGAIGAAHAGWRGTLGDVVGNAVRAMAAAFAARPGDVCAVIGPSIGPADFEVGPEVVAAFQAALGPEAASLVHPGRGDRAFIDLPAANRLLLLRAGLEPRRIQIDGASTASAVDRFFSHRAEGGRTGRFGAFIGRPPR